MHAVQGSIDRAALDFPEANTRLAEIADGEVETRPVVKRWRLTRPAVARRFDADDLGAEVGWQPPA